MSPSLTARRRIKLAFHVNAVAGPVSVLLRTSATAAMGALLLISVSHRELFAWAARMIGADEPP